MSEKKQYIIEESKKIFSQITDFNVDDKIDIINNLKLLLYEISPMNTEPVDCVIWVKNDTVTANDYNPNKVASPELELLTISITEDGYTQPVVTFLEKEEQRTVVDGFHRSRVGKECKEISDRVMGYLPVVTINKDKEGKDDRMAATIRHNRARGKHTIDAMSDIIIELKRRNWSDKKIGEKLGMQPDEVLRLSQISGLAELFSDKEFSKSWEIEINEDFEKQSL